MFKILMCIGNFFDRVINTIIKLRHYIPRETLKSMCTEVWDWSEFSEFLN